MEKINKWITPVLLVSLLISVAIGVYQTDRLREKLRNAEHNISALTDTVRDMELKNGELVKWNYSLIADKQEIKESLEKENLSKRELERKLNSNINQLTKLVSEFRSDTILVTDTVEYLKDSTFLAPFGYSDEWLTVSGKTLFRLDGMTSMTEISGISVRVPLTIGLTENNQVFVHTENPDASIELLNSLTLEPKNYNKKRFGIGIYAGFGMQYGILKKNIDVGPQIGLGVYFRLL